MAVFTSVTELCTNRSHGLESFVGSGTRGVTCSVSPKLPLGQGPTKGASISRFRDPVGQVHQTLAKRLPHVPPTSGAGNVITARIRKSPDM